MSEVVKVFADEFAGIARAEDYPRTRGGQMRVSPERPTWWLILDCGHWYHWTGTDAPKAEGDFPCPDCKRPIVVMPHAQDEQVKCAVCGLIYPKSGPYPPCRSDDGEAGPKGVDAAGRSFMKCVLSVKGDPA